MTVTTGRRELLAALGGAAVAWPVAAHAQQPGMPVIGFVSGRSPNESTGVVAAFRRGLGETGFVEGQNLVIAFRWAEGRYHQLPALAGELVGLRVGVLVAAGGTASALAAKAATATIPIVFTAVGDPVGTGLVASLSRPEANVTGMSALAGTAIAGKRIELLKRSVPTAAEIAFLVNPSSPNSVTELNEALAAANTLGIPVHVLNASTEGDLEAAFASVVRLRAGGLVVAIEAFFHGDADHLQISCIRMVVEFWRDCPPYVCPVCLDLLAVESEIRASLRCACARQQHCSNDESGGFHLCFPPLRYP